MNIRFLLIFAFSFFLLVLIPNAIAEDISACGTLGTSNTIYNLAQNVNSTGTCFTVTGENITLDCKGYEINYSSNGGSSEYGISVIGRYNATIKNCVVKEGISGILNHAIYFQETYTGSGIGSRNGTIYNNTITTLGSLGNGIYLYQNSKSNFITNNTITTSGTGAIGINVVQVSNSNIISNNTITTNGSTGYGIYISASLYNKFSNNILNINGNDSAGIYFLNSLNSNVSLNTINTFGISGYGIYLRSGSNSNTFSSNTITTSGNLGYGIYLDTSSLNNVSNNIINATGANGRGFYLYSSSTNILSFNTITTSNTAGYGIYLRYISNSNTISSNTITTSGSTGYGMFLDFTSNSNTISSNTIITYGNEGRGILVYLSSDSNTFSNDSVTTYGSNSYGIFLSATTLNNSFSKMNIKTNSSPSLYIYMEQHNFTIVDSILNSSYPNIPDFAINNTVGQFKKIGIWNFTNVTRSNGDKINISWSASANGTLNYKWWLVSNVTNSLGNLQGATTYAYDKSGNLISSGTTDSNGNSKIALPEYTNINNTLITYYSNYTINITKTGYKSYTAIVNMTNNTLLNTELNYIPTIPNLISPADLSSIATNYAILKYNSTDVDNATDTITFWVYGDTNIDPTTLIFNGTGYGNSSYNWSGMSNGNYYWKVKAGDGKDNSSNSSVYKFTVSTDAPAITLNYPTYGLWLATTSVLFNFTAEDSDGIQDCNLWSNFSGVWNFNETIRNIISGYHNTTSKTLNNEHYYIWNVNCSDTLGNHNFYTSNFTFYVDSVYPALSIKEITTVDNSQTISFDINNTDYAISSCKYSIYKNNSIDGLYNNISVNCVSNDNSATVSAYGAFTLRVYGKDMAGNENSTNLSFTTRQVTSESPGGGGSTVIEEIRCSADEDCTPKLGKEYKCVQTYCIFKPYEDVCNRNGICEPERGEHTGNCGDILLENQTAVLEGDCLWTSGTDLLRIALSTNYILWTVFILMVLSIVLLVQTKEGSFTKKTYRRYFRRRR